MQSVNLVQWEEALSSTEENKVILKGESRPNKSKARLYKESTCRQCDDRRLVGEDYEDIKKKRILVLILMTAALKHAVLILLTNFVQMGSLML